MSLTKVDYIKNQTIITADNLNDIQNNIIINENRIDTVDAQLENIQDNITSLNNNFISTKENIATEINDLQEAIDDKVRFVETATLEAANWSNKGYVLSLVNNLQITDTPHITLTNVSESTKEEYSKISYANTISNNGVTKLRFTCLEDVPTVDLKIQIEVIR